MQKTYKSFMDSLRGFKVVLMEERNFKIEIIISLLVLIFVTIFDFSSYEIIPLVIVMFMVITAEVVNTAIEDICNKIEPGYNEVIGKVKDIMAAYVLLTVICSIIVGSIVVFNHFAGNLLIHFLSY